MTTADTKPFSGFPLVLATIFLSLCTFMQVLDSSIANVAIPYISGSLAVSENNGTWVITLFMVGNAIALPLTGFLTKRFGSIKLIVASTLLFSLFSWLCALAFTFNMLLISRFLQGFVAGPLIPLSQSLLLLSFPKEKKNLALALWSMVVLVGPITGPILGGWLTYDYSWPWIFNINVPIGLACSFVIWKLFKDRETPTEKSQIDWMGICFLVIGVSCLQILLDRGEQMDWFHSNGIRTLGAISLVGFIFLFVWELLHENPIMDFKLFKNRNFAMGTVLTALSYMMLFGAIVISPLWLQTQMGYTALLAGLAVSTMGVLPLFAAPLVAKIMDKVGSRYPLFFGFTAFALSYFYFTTFTTHVTMSQVAISRLYFGIGICAWLAPLTALTLAYVSPEKLPSATGIFHFFRIFFGGVGTSFMVTLWDRRTIRHHHNLVESVNKFNPLSNQMMRDLASEGLTGESGKVAFDVVVDQQASMLALNDVFYLAGWSFVLFAVLALAFKKRKQLGDNPIAAH